MLQNTTKEQIDFNEFNKGGKILVFHAAWCGQCKLYAPVLEELSSKNFEIYKIDVDVDRLYTREFQVKKVPTTLIFKDGELKETLVGFKAAEEIEDLVKSL